MGRPGTGSSSHLPQQKPQNQSEYDLQPQEYQYEATHEAIASGDHHEVALTYESNHYVEENQPDQCQPEQPNNLQAQQQFQPPQPPQQQQQQQPTQFPLQQTNQAYGAQPQRPIRMQQNNQIYQDGQHQPGAYPPQGPKPMPAQPVNFPLASPQNNDMYQNVQTHPGAYQQQGSETIPAKPEQFQPPQPPQQQQQQQPTQFPPQQTNQAYGAQPQRPIRMQQNNQMYQDGQHQPGAHPPQGPKPMPAQPVNFPPACPQNNQMYQNVQTHPGAYQQQGPETIPAKPEQFLPPSPRKSPMFQNGQNRSPAYQQQGQQPMQAHSIPVNFPPTVQNFPPTMGQGYQTPPVQEVQFQQSNGQQYVPAGSVPGIPRQRPGSQWSSGLFDCMNDPMNALITALFPCLTFGRIAEIVDRGQTSRTSICMMYVIVCCISLPCMMSCTYRTKLRSKFGLAEAPMPDWITHFLCEWCALCQEYRELQSRGLDPSIGWLGNMAKNQNMHQQQVVMMPPVNQTMMG